MCARYEPLSEMEAFRMFTEGGQAVPIPSGQKAPPMNDTYPMRFGTFVRRPGNREAGDDEIPPYEALPGNFGLVPRWSKELKQGRNCYNARTETVAAKNSFRDAWKRAQHCIIPAWAIYEPDWRSRKAVATRIARADGLPMGIAGLWETWKDPAGKVIHSYTMLTINADNHELMRNFHREEDEKRMVVILPRGLYDDWLDAPTEKSMDFMRQFPADRLVATAQAAASRPEQLDS